jgi:hypothetical protein
MVLAGVVSFAFRSWLPETGDLPGHFQSVAAILAFGLVLPASVLATLVLGLSVPSPRPRSARGGLAIVSTLLVVFLLAVAIGVAVFFMALNALG